MPIVDAVCPSKKAGSIKMLIFGFNKNSSLHYMMSLFRFIPALFLPPLPLLVSELLIASYKHNVLTTSVWFFSVV
jgi:cytochrome c oxidase subunit IV